MLQLIPTSQARKEPSNASDSQVLANSPFKKNSFFTVGFKANPEDNADRKKKVGGFLAEFQTQLQRLHEKESPLSLRDKIKESSESLNGILESIFCLFNVNIQLIQQDQSDSALRIEPVVHIGKAIQCLTYIAIVLNRFPYSFIKIIDLNKFTVCKHVHLKKEGHTDLFNARILTNAMFMTDVHDTYDKVESHFYKVVLHHVLKKLPSLQTDWPIDNSPKLSPQRDASKRFMTISPGLNRSSPTLSRRSVSPSSRERPDKSKNKLPVEELKVKERTEIFYKLLTNPSFEADVTDQRIQAKISFLKEKLEYMDPIGVCQEWWGGLCDRDITVAEKPNGEFLLKF